jgi:molecular chaperone GrpE (heat shock protein)
MVDPAGDGVEAVEAIEQAVAGPEAAEEASSGEQLAQALDRFDDRLEEAHRLLERQTDLVDKLHAENQALRAGEIRAAQMPLVRGLLSLSDDVARLQAAAGESTDLALVRDSVVETLRRNGIEPFAPAAGEQFDAAAHSVSGVERTADEQLDKTIAEVVRQGFRWDSGEVIRVAEVRALRYEAPG